MGGSISILRNSLASCVNPLNFATGDLIDSCYTSNSSISCLQDERYRAAEFIAAAPLNDGIPQTSQFAVEPGMVATGPILLGLFFVSSE